MDPSAYTRGLCSPCWALQAHRCYDMVAACKKGDSKRVGRCKKSEREELPLINVSLNILPAKKAGEVLLNKMPPALGHRAQLEFRSKRQGSTLHEQGHTDQKTLHSIRKGLSNLTGAHSLVRLRGWTRPLWVSGPVVRLRRLCFVLTEIHGKSVYPLTAQLSKLALGNYQALLT